VLLSIRENQVAKGFNAKLYICLINGPAFSRLPEQPGDILEYRREAKRDE
jgi:hypothetical protein